MCPSAQCTGRPERHQGTGRHCSLPRPSSPSQSLVGPVQAALLCYMAVHPAPFAFKISHGFTPWLLLPRPYPLPCSKEEAEGVGAAAQSIFPKNFLILSTSRR